MADLIHHMQRPKGLEKWIIENALKTYWLFRKGENYAYCTRACCWIEISRRWQIRNGTMLNSEICPNKKCKLKHICAMKTYWKAKDITCKDVDCPPSAEPGRILWFRRQGETTYAQLDSYDIKYNSSMFYASPKPKVEFEISAQYKFNKKEQKGIRREPYTFGIEPIFWDMARPHVPYIGGMCWTYRHENTKVFPDIKLGSDLQYAILPTSWKTDPYFIIKYISLFLKFQAVELLQKSGFESLVEWRCYRGEAGPINYRKKSLQEILGLTKEEIKIFREACSGKGNPSSELRNLYIYRSLKNLGYKVYPADLKNIGEKIQNRWAFGYETDVLALIKTAKKYKVKADKLLRYLMTQETGTLFIWDDYIKDCKWLGLNLKDKKIMFPKNLYLEHMIRADEKAKAIVAQTYKLFSVKNKETAGMQEAYVKNGFIIKPIEDIEELNRESEMLTHCVKSYADKVVIGKCSILGLRKANAPQEPFYTVEISPEHEIKQCRGDHNCGYDKEIESFLTSWQHDVYGIEFKGGATI